MEESHNDMDNLIQIVEMEKGRESVSRNNSKFLQFVK